MAEGGIEICIGRTSVLRCLGLVVTQSLGRSSTRESHSKLLLKTTMFLFSMTFPLNNSTDQGSTLVTWSTSTFSGDTQETHPGFLQQQQMMICLVGYLMAVGKK